MLNLKTINLKGFTLVETLVATFVITVVIVGPLTVASNASMYAKLTKDTMIATYLAQESIELLRHQQDSVYIRCVDQSSSECVAISGETPGEAAWRIFKERLGSNPQGSSCFTSSNPSGCSYDYVDMTTNESINPTKYVSTNAQCNTLSYDPASSVYVCTGVRGSGLRQTTFSRLVKIESVPTWSGADAGYNDDLRATVIVNFRRPNGFMYQIKVVDFLHARA